MQPGRARIVLALALLLPLALAGCTNEDRSRASQEVIQAVANIQPTTWTPGDHWNFRATFGNERVYHIAIVVHESDARGFRLGSNVSSGFFGLPFSGNVTRDFNPEISGKVWPMYQFPLVDGKEWSYTMFGYDAKTTAYAALIDVPGHGRVPGYRLEASSYGQVFARYDYSPVTGWFTRLEIVDPSTREQKLEAVMDSFGSDFGGGYFVERVIRSARITYPATEAPAPIPIEIGAGYLRVRSSLTAEATAGVVDARVENDQGATVLEARATGKGVGTDRATSEGGGARWTLHHAGAGVGEVYVEVTGVKLEGRPGVRYQEADETIDLGAMLSALRPPLEHVGTGSHPQSTIPVSTA